MTENVFHVISYEFPDFSVASWSILVGHGKLADLTDLLKY